MKQYQSNPTISQCGTEGLTATIGADDDGEGETIR